MTLRYTVRMMALALAKVGSAARWAAWGYWVCYLLETLEKEVDPLEYGAFLESLQGRIEMRRQSGHWRQE